MGNILHIILVIFFSLIVISCGNDKDETTDDSNTSTTLSAPTGLSATGSAGQVILDWTTLSGASSYTVYWDNLTGVSSSSTAITSVSTDNYTHIGLDNGTTYYYKVVAVNSSGTGTISSVASALLAANILGSETNEGHTYALTNTQMNWNEAATAASALGGYLATLNTRAENTWLFEKFGKYGGTNRDLWIGAKDDVTEGSWYWDNGTTSGDDNVSDNISSGAKWPDGEKKWAGSVEPVSYTHLRAHET